MLDQLLDRIHSIPELNGYSLIFIALLNYTAIRQKWNWYMNWYQIEWGIKKWGYPSLKRYMYWSSAIMTVIGFYFLIYAFIK